MAMPASVSFAGGLTTTGAATARAGAEAGAGGQVGASCAMGGAGAEAGAGIASGDIHVGFEAEQASLRDELATVLGAARQAAVRGVQQRATAATRAEEREWTENGVAVQEAKELYAEYVALRFRLFAEEETPCTRLPLLPPAAAEFFGAVLQEWDHASFAATSAAHMEDGCGAEAGTLACNAEPATPQLENRARRASRSPRSSVSSSEQFITSTLRTEVAALRTTRNAAERRLARLGRCEVRCAGELGDLRACCEEAEAACQQQPITRKALEEANTAILHAHEDRIAREALVSRLRDEVRSEALAARRMLGAGSSVEEEEIGSELQEVDARVSSEEQATAQSAEAVAVPRRPLTTPAVLARSRDLAAATPAGACPSRSPTAAAGGRGAAAAAAPMDTAALEVEVAGLTSLCERMAKDIASAYQVRDQLTSEAASWRQKAGVAVSELQEAESMLTSLSLENSKLRLELGNLEGRHMALAPAEGQPPTFAGTAAPSSQVPRRPSPAPAPARQPASILQTLCGALPRGRVVLQSNVPMEAEAGGEAGRSGGGGAGAAAAASPAASVVVAEVARMRPTGGPPATAAAAAVGGTPESASLAVALVTPRATQQPPPEAGLTARSSAGEGGLDEARLQSRRGRLSAMTGKGASGVHVAASSDCQRSLSVGTGSLESPHWRP